MLSAALFASSSKELELVSLGRNLLGTAVPGQCQGLLPRLPLLLLYCGLPLSLGWILIDRCGKHFGTILNYLRDGAVPLPESRREIEELLAEAKYYLVQGLVDECQAALQVGRGAKESSDYSGCNEGSKRGGCSRWETASGQSKIFCWPPLDVFLRLG